MVLKRDGADAQAHYIDDEIASMESISGSCFRIETTEDFVEDRLLELIFLTIVLGELATRFKMGERARLIRKIIAANGWSERFDRETI